MKRMLVVTLAGSDRGQLHVHRTKEAGLKYPVARKDNVVDDYGGTKVADPYRWMEALDSKEVADWVAASNAVTEPYLKNLPLREHFNKRLTELWNYPRVGLPVVEAGKLFYARNAGLQRQAPVYMRASISAPPTLVIDPERDLRRRVGVAGAVDAVPGREASCLRPRRRGRRLAHHSRARYRLGQGPRRRDQVDAVLGHLVDEGQQRLLLLAIPRAAEEQGARSGTLGSRHLLSPRRHSAVAGHPDLRAQGSAGVDHQRFGVRGRAVSLRPDVPGRRESQSPLHRRPGQGGRSESRCADSTARRER